MPEKQTVKENVRKSRNRNDGDAKTKLKYHKCRHKTKGATRTQLTEKKTFRNVTLKMQLLYCMDIYPIKALETNQEQWRRKNMFKLGLSSLRLSKSC